MKTTQKQKELLHFWVQVGPVSVRLIHSHMVFNVYFFCVLFLEEPWFTSMSLNLSLNKICPLTYGLEPCG